MPCPHMAKTELELTCTEPCPVFCVLGTQPPERLGTSAGGVQGAERRMFRNSHVVLSVHNPESGLSSVFCSRKTIMVPSPRALKAHQVRTRLGLTFRVAALTEGPLEELWSLALHH